MAQEHVPKRDSHVDAREQILQAMREMQYVTDPRRMPDGRRRVNFRMGWEDAVSGRRTISESSLQHLSWRNVGYRLGQLFGDRPEYVDLAFDVLVEQYTEQFSKRGDEAWQALSDPARRKLERLLERFSSFRAKHEERYLQQERKFKQDLLDGLAKAWEQLDDDPAESRDTLLQGMRGEDRAISSALDQMLGGRGYMARQRFAAYLEQVSVDDYAFAMASLFDRQTPFIERVRGFRDTIGLAYEDLYAEGKFRERSNRPPNIPQLFVGVFLASYDPERYILYRKTEHEKTALWLGLQVPARAEHRYAAFQNMAGSILQFARERQAPVADFLDVHNMMYMLWRYDEFADLHSPARSTPAGQSREEQAEVADESIYDFLRAHRFVFPEWLVTSYVLSLAAKPFVILSGISGTGKTKLAQLVADYIGRALGTAEHKAFVSVRPDWTDNSHLLGWYNAISNQYETTQLLKLLMDASDASAQPHFIILDEMNIAKVEHYFSDFLSCMESRFIGDDGHVKQEPMQLHCRTERDDPEEDDIPGQIVIPTNVYVTGTVNVDESTYMFSPKVLDRANVIEFNDVFLDDAEPDGATGNPFVLRSDVTVLDLLGDYKLPSRAEFEQMRERMPTQFEHLLAIHRALLPYNLHFGYRVANEVAAFILHAERFCEPNESLLPMALDLQVLQKMLPKSHGNAAQLEPPIESLLNVLPASCVMSRAKLERMRTRLRQVGFASFIE